METQTQPDTATLIATALNCYGMLRHQIDANTPNSFLGRGALVQLGNVLTHLHTQRATRLVVIRRTVAAPALPAPASDALAATPAPTVLHALAPLSLPPRRPGMGNRRRFSLRSFFRLQ